MEAEGVEREEGALVEESRAVPSGPALTATTLLPSSALCLRRSSSHDHRRPIACAHPTTRSRHTLHTHSAAAMSKQESKHADEDMKEEKEVSNGNGSASRADSPPRADECRAATARLGSVSQRLQRIASAYWLTSAR